MKMPNYGKRDSCISDTMTVKGACVDRSVAFTWSSGDNVSAVEMGTDDGDWCRRRRALLCDCQRRVHGRMSGCPRRGAKPLSAVPKAHGGFMGYQSGSKHGYAAANTTHGTRLWVIVGDCINPWFSCRDGCRRTVG